MSLCYNDYDLAGVDLGLQPAIDLRNLSIAHNLLSGEHMHHATIDGADSDFLGLLRLPLLGFFGRLCGLNLYLNLGLDRLFDADIVFGHCCSPFVWGFAGDYGWLLTVLQVRNNVGLCYFYGESVMRKRIQMKAPVHMTWRLEEELYERVVEAAEATGVSVSAFVRNVIKRELSEVGSLGRNDEETH